MDDGDPDDAVQLLDHAERMAGRGDRCLSTLQWVGAVRAQAHAELGDDWSCRRDLDLAGTVVDLPKTRDVLGWLRFDGDRLAEQRGTCLVTGRRFDEAESILEDALSRSSTVRRRAGILIDLAHIGVERRDPSRVVPRLEEAVASARTTGSRVIVNRLRNVTIRLAPIGSHPQVRELNEQIARLSGEEHGDRVV